MTRTGLPAHVLTRHGRAATRIDARRIPAVSLVFRGDQSGPQLAELVAHGRYLLDDRFAHAVSVV